MAGLDRQNGHSPQNESEHEVHVEESIRDLRSSAKILMLFRGWHSPPSLQDLDRDVGAVLQLGVVGQE